MFGNLWVSEIRRILDSMIWFQRDCDEETRRLSSQVTRYAFTSDDRRSATGMLNLCRQVNLHSRHSPVAKSLRAKSRKAVYWTLGQYGKSQVFTRLRLCCYVDVTLQITSPLIFLIILLSRRPDRKSVV